MDLQVMGVVKHGGKWYEPGDEIKKVKKEDAEQMIALGVAKEIVKEAPSKPKTKE